jgi:alkaline phosphatase D
MRYLILASVAFGLAACATAPKSAPAAIDAAPAARAVETQGPLFDFPQAPQSPAITTGAITKIVLASCLNEEFNRDQKVLELMAGQKADLAILMGDNVYGSSAPDDPLLSDLRAAYWQQARRKDFIGLVSATPTLAVWDDHDYGRNDAGADHVHRDLARQMFQRFWRLSPGHPQYRPEGVYGSYVVGPEGQKLQVIMLDTRYFRSPLTPTDQRNAPGKERYIPSNDPGNTVLGAAQWAWLEGELKKPADLRLIVSSIQIVADGHGYERWGNFPLEQKRFFDVVRASGAKGVVVASGDRHLAGLYREPGETVGYPIYDFTASSVNMPWGAGGQETAGSRRITPAHYQENYGLMNIDWAARAVTLSLRDKADAVVWTQRIPFAEIGAK